MTVEPDYLYLPKEVAGMLRCSVPNVYGLLNRGDLRRTCVGAGKSGIRVQGSDLLAFLESRKTGGPKPMGSFKYLKMRPA
jgi:hypothetical protein